MPKNSHSTLKHITTNKQVIVATIVLSLAVIFIFLSDEQSNAKSFTRAPVKDQFVVKAHENAIQESEIKAEKATDVNAVIYDKVMSEHVHCPYQNVVNLPAATSTPLADRRVRVPILMYHYVDLPGSSTLPWLYHPPEIFEAQLKTLADQCYNSIFVSDVSQAITSGVPLQSRSIALTFDDGYENMYTQAFPLLKKYNMKGTMYIIVNALDKPGYLTKAQAKEMSDSGYVEIASHTFNHPDLRTKSPEASKYEIMGSKGALEKIIGRSVTDFAYPYGFLTASDEEICRQAGYLTCASTYPGQVQTYGKRFTLYRLRPAYRIGNALTSWLELAGPKI